MESMKVVFLVSYEHNTNICCRKVLHRMNKKKKIRNCCYLGNLCIIREDRHISIILIDKIYKLNFDSSETNSLQSIYLLQLTVRLYHILFGDKSLREKSRVFGSRRKSNLQIPRIQINTFIWNTLIQNNWQDFHFYSILIIYPYN